MIVLLALLLLPACACSLLEPSIIAPGFNMPTLVGRKPSGLALSPDTMVEFTLYIKEEGKREMVKL
jgi:hypothetical protein